MSEKLDLRSLTSEELEALVTSQDFEAYRGRQLFKWLWTPGVHSFDRMSNLPLRLRKRLKEISFINFIDPINIQESVDGTKKFASRLKCGQVVESVIIPEDGHNTLCISSQVGCQMGCSFCRTAKMGFIRNLEPSEIVLQALTAIEILGSDRKKLRNIVFMGMGEPLNNYENVSKAISILQDREGLDFSKRRITVSTCGIIPKILCLGKEHEVGLAVSLHASFDKKRSDLMPVNRKYGLDELLQALKSYPLPRRRRITIEYLLLRDINDSAQDARELAKRLSCLRTKINLIAFNEVPGIPFKAPKKEAVLEFQKILQQKGFTVTIRKSKGADIDAACGQLYARVVEGG